MNQSIRIPAQVAEGDFAGWLGGAMTARRISLRMLAIRAGMDHSTISRLANGSREPLLATALALIRVLEAQPLHLASVVDLEDAPSTAA